MIQFAAEETFINDILRGLRRRLPEIDIVRIQDTEIYQSEDDIVLEWCAAKSRILLTHDGRTMPRYAYARIAEDNHMLGVFIISDEMPIGYAINELIMVFEASTASDWHNRVVFLPL